MAHCESMRLTEFQQRFRDEDQDNDLLSRTAVIRVSVVWEERRRDAIFAFCHSTGIAPQKRGHGENAITP
jgi:hypothetical protein